MSEKGNSGNQ